jgi:hypothetical protein
MIATGIARRYVMSFNLADAMAVLERTPSTLATLLRTLPDVWVLAREGPGTWSPYEVIGHLIHGERTDWMPRVRHILAGTGEPFEPFDRYAQLAERRGTSLEQVLATLAELRARNLAELRALELGDADMTRRGQHPELGEVTLGQLLATWVVHDMDHVGQIARTMAKVYADDVGPWSAYLSILHDRRRVGA